MIRLGEGIGSRSLKSRLFNSSNGIKIGVKILSDRTRDTKIGY
jgi:hypothetical protein